MQPDLMQHDNKITDKVQVVGRRVNRIVQSRDRKIQKLQVHNDTLNKGISKVEYMKKSCHSKVLSARKIRATDVEWLNDKIKLLWKIKDLYSKKKRLIMIQSLVSKS